MRPPPPSYPHPQSPPFSPQSCADAALSELIAADTAAGAPRRSSVLWYVASDRPDAVMRVRQLAAARNASTPLPLSVIDLAISAVLHTDNSPVSRRQRRRLEEGGGATVRLIETFADHFLLSTAHAHVRSRSGFSESAESWGGVPLSYTLEGKACRRKTKLSLGGRRRRLRRRARESPQYRPDL